MSVTINNVVYDISFGNRAFVKGFTETPISVTIVSNVTINGTEYVVDSIGIFSFLDCNSLTSITIPTSVTNIQQSAFKNCTSLTSINIPNSVDSISNEAFKGCTNLTSITLPIRLSILATSLFENCQKLTSITIPDGVSQIFSRVFAGCVSLETIVIPNSVILMTSNVFEGCTRLNSVTLSENVTTIGSNTFLNCASLNSITIPSIVTFILTGAFKNTGLISITIPEGVRSIGNDVFDGCLSLTSIIIPNTVTTIGLSAFRDCRNLTSITIPNNITGIGNETFNRCFSLTSITIPNKVNSIGSNAFRECTSLASITIPDSVTNIYNSAFYNCTSLTSITIPNRVIIINSNTFYGCTSLTSINIPDGVTTIGSGAFYNCTNLNSITIPNSVTSIGNDVFFYCTSLNSINIPDGVTIIGSNAFMNCTSLTSITIPNSVTTIGANAFRDCTSLTSIVIQNPHIITTINTDSFTNVFNNQTSNIVFYNTSEFNNLSSTWQIISGYYNIKIYNPQDVPTITNFSISSKPLGGESFQINPPTSTVDGTFSYTSSDINVATIDGNIITIVGIGTSLVIATQLETANYTSETVTATFQVYKPAPTITNFSISSKPLGEGSFQIVPPTSTSDGTFSYTSSDKNVATIDGNTITIVGVGNTIITATQLETANYTSGIATATFQVYKPAPTITNFSISSKPLGEGSFQIVPPTSTSDGTFSYTSSDKNVATIDGNTITIVGVGNTIITATQLETANYASGIATATFQVYKLIPTITNFSISSKTFGEGSFQIVPPTSNSNGTFSYTSSDKNVATIDGNTITIVGVGNTIITATQSETANYTSASVSNTFIVQLNTPKNPIIVNNIEKLLNVLKSSVEYIHIENEMLNIDFNLISNHRKVLTGNNAIIKRITN